MLEQHLPTEVFSMPHTSLLQKRKHPHTKKVRHADERHAAPLLTALLKSLFFSLLIGIGLLLVLSLGLYFSPNPTPFIAPLGIAAAGICAVFGGMIAKKQIGESPLMCGLLIGSAMNALMLLLSLFFRSRASGYSALYATVLHVSFFACSVAGAYLAARKKPQKRKLRKKRRA